MSQTIRLVSKIREKEEELQLWENVISKREVEIEQLIQRKQKEVSLTDLTQTIRLVSKIREKEEELLLWEDNLNKKKQQMEAFNSRIKAKRKNCSIRKTI